MMKKKSWMALVLLAGVFCIPSVNAVPILNDSIVEDFVLPSDPSIVVTVASSVADLGGGIYEYTYQVRGIGDLNIISLSVPFSSPLMTPAEVGNFDDGGDAATLYWGPIGNPSAVSAYALFNPQQLQGGITTEYKFTSAYAAEEVTGFADEALKGSLYGTLYAPIPEPATLSLLAMGAGILFRTKRK